MSLINQTNLGPVEHILKYACIYLNMRKISDEKLEKCKTNDDNA